MVLSPSQLRTIPLFRGIPDEYFEPIYALFERLEVDEGHTLFLANEVSETFYVLEEGELILKEDEKVLFHIHPPAQIGEVGALTGLNRNTTAVTSKPCVFWVAQSDVLLSFFNEHPEIALPFYQNLLRIVGDKVQRDQLRLEDMRTNIIRTQKAMKSLRDYLLESQDTPISDRLHDTLEDLIRHNRRVNYRVEPPELLPSYFRLDDSTTAHIVQISRTHISFLLEGSQPPPIGSTWSAVMLLSGPEIPVSGTVLRYINGRVDIGLDLLMEEYSAILDNYLTRIQLIDFMV